jgi:hypothetical protein
MHYISKYLAALVLSAGLLGLSGSAHAYTDSTPYGLIFASGTLTNTQATLFNGTSYYELPAGEQDQVSLAFFRPATGPATSAFSFGQFLPGAVKVTKADGTVLLDVPSVQPSYVYFAFWYGGFPVPIPIISANINYQGQAATLSVIVTPSADFGTAQVQIQVTLNDGTIALWRAGSLSGVDIVDP